MRKKSFGFLAWFCSTAGALLGAGFTAPMGLDMDAPAGERTVWMGLFFLAVFLGGAIGLNLGLALDRRRRVIRSRFWLPTCLASAALLFAAGFGGQLLFMRSHEEVTIPSAADVVLLLDASSSMDSSGCSVPRTEAACQFVDSLDEDCRLQVISFASTVLDQSPMLEMDAQGKQTLKEMIAEIDSIGNTDFNAPLRQARDTLNGLGRQDCGKAVILLTDGEGDLDRDVVSEYSMDEIRVMTIRISSVPWLDTRAKKLVALAENTGGFDTQLTPGRDGSVNTDEMLEAFQKAFQSAVEVRPAVSGGFLICSEGTSGYQFLVRTATLLVCAVLFGLGYFGRFQWKMAALSGAFGVVLSLLITLFSSGVMTGVHMTCLLLGGAYVTFETDSEEVIDV